MSTVLPTREPGNRERLFFSGMSVAMMALVFAGFARTFFLRTLFPESAALAAPEPVFYVHGAVFTAWMLLLILQTGLIAAGRTTVHRRVGTVGAGLACVVVVFGLVAAVTGARRPEGFIGVPVPALQFLAVPVFDMVLFAVFAAMGIGWRRNPQHHKRFMLLATINLLGAASARLPWAFIATGPPLLMLLLPSLFLVPLALWDLRALGRIHPVTLWAGLVTIASQPVRLAIMDTPAWLVIARTLTELPG